MFFFVSIPAGDEASGPPADGGQVLSGEKWWVAQSYLLLDTVLYTPDAEYYWSPIFFPIKLQNMKVSLTLLSFIEE